MDLAAAISDAESLLRLEKMDAGSDPRWQAIIELGEHIETSPEEIWQFISRARVGADEDLEDAISTVLLEHLFEHHEKYRQKAHDIAMTDPQMKSMIASCW